MYKNKLAYTLTHQHPGEQFEQCKDCEDTFAWAARTDKHRLGAHCPWGWTDFVQGVT